MILIDPATWITRMTQHITKLILLYIAVLILGACSPQNTHLTYLQEELAKVSYDNGISITEAKIIGDAYLYRYAREGNKVSHIRVRSGKDDKQNKWLGDIYSGVAISPVAATLAPIEIDKLNGKVSWAHGPTIIRVDLNSTS